MSQHSLTESLTHAVKHAHLRRLSDDTMTRLLLSCGPLRRLSLLSHSVNSVPATWSRSTQTKHLASPVQSAGRLAVRSALFQPVCAPAVQL